MSEYTHDGPPIDGIPVEKPWYRQLADWSARPPHKLGHRREDFRIWLCEIFHTINDMVSEIDRLRDHIAELEAE